MYDGDDGIPNGGGAVEVSPNTYGVRRAQHPMRNTSWHYA